MKTMWECECGENELTIIEDDVRIGTQSVILSGVTIGRGSIVAAGSVLTKVSFSARFGEAIPHILLKTDSSQKKKTKTSAIFKTALPIMCMWF